MGTINMETAATLNWFWAIIVLPMLIGMFKTEIGRIIRAWNVHRLREFDLDGNPGTENVAQILNVATGKWNDVVIECYRFTLSAKTRGIYLRYPDGGKEKVSYLTWANFRKRMPPSSRTKLR